MKILYIAGSVNPGKTGIGDYIRLNAVLNHKSGHSCSFLSFYDFDIDAPFYATQELEGYSFPALRLTGNYGWVKKYRLMKSWIKTQEPDIIEFHYCPYSWQSGIFPFWTYFFLLLAIRKRHVQVYVHELMLSTSRLRAPLYRTLFQYFLILAKPVLIKTHSTYFRKCLKEMGFASVAVPLISNIPRVHDLLTSIDKVKSGVLTCVVFGNLRNTPATLTLFAEELREVASALGLIPEVVFMGLRINLEIATSWYLKFETAGVTCKDVGSLPASEVSEILCRASIGVASTPYQLSEKSSVVAAFKEHATPCFCLNTPFDLVTEEEADSWHLPGLNYTKGSLEKVIRQELSIREPDDASQAILSLASPY